jgi:putative MATE family efflux protein
MWLTTSGALLSKVGAEVSIGQSIGARKMEDARLYASHTTTIALIMSLLIAVTLLIGADFILSFFRLSPEISNEAANYLRIVSNGLPFVFLVLTFSGIYNAAGRSTIPFYLMATGLVGNMILDPLFIFGLGWGTQGAAWATLLSQLLVFILFIRQLKQRSGILNRFPIFIKLQKTYSLRILYLGFPVAVMSTLFAVLNMTLARIASIFGGHIGLMSQTTGGQIEGVTWNTSQGFSTALGAFVAQNYGAGKKDRTKKAYQYTLMLMSLSGVIISAGFLLFGKEIFGIFVPEEPAKIAGGEYLTIMGVSQLFMMWELTTQGMFNGYGKTLPPAIVSISFNIARIPLALYLAPIYGVAGIWWSIVISSILKGIILPVWLACIYKRNLK